MPNFIICKQAKIDGEDSPKVISLGKVAIETSEVTCIYTLNDKHDFEIKGVVMIVTKTGNYLVKGGFMEMLEEVKNANIGT